MYHNALTKQAYSPRNQQLLADSAALSGFEGFEVAGFRQWLELGRVVAKGQHGTRIYMVCTKKGKPDDNGEPKRFQVMKTRTVFFAEQTVEIATETAAA